MMNNEERGTIPPHPPPEPDFVAIPNHTSQDGGVGLICITQM